MPAYRGSKQENILELLRIGCSWQTPSHPRLVAPYPHAVWQSKQPLRTFLQLPYPQLGWASKHLETSAFNSHSLAHQLTQKAGFNGHLIKCEVLVRGAKISKSHTNCVKPGHQWKARRELVEMVEMKMVETHGDMHSSFPKSSHNPKTQHLIWASQISSETHSIASSQTKPRHFQILQSASTSSLPPETPDLTQIYRSGILELNISFKCRSSTATISHFPRFLTPWFATYKRALARKQPKGECEPSPTGISRWWCVGPCGDAGWRSVVAGFCWVDHWEPVVDGYGNRW